MLLSAPRTNCIAFLASTLHFWSEAPPNVLPTPELLAVRTLIGCPATCSLWFVSICFEKSRSPVSQLSDCLSAKDQAPHLAAAVLQEFAVAPTILVSLWSANKKGFPGLLFGAWLDLQFRKFYLPELS